MTDEQVLLTKECKKCGEVKDLASFYRYTDKRRAGGDGYKGMCKSCHDANPSRGRPYRQQMKAQIAHRSGREYRTAEAFRRLQRERALMRAERRAERQAVERIARDKQREVERSKLWATDVHYPGMSKVKARKKVGNALAHGWITKPEHCSHCGHSPPSHRLHAHHEDYEYPLRIEWLCGGCHADLHGRPC